MLDLLRYSTHTSLRKYGLFIVLIWAVQTVFAQVQLKVDTTQIRIGEQIHYELSTEKQPKVVFPQLVLDSLKKVEVVREFPIDTLKNRLYKRYLLTSFDSGSYVIPGQQVMIDNKQYITDSLLINVGTVAVDTTKQGLFPIKPIYKAPPKAWQEYLYILWWILAILALILLIWWLAFRSKKVIQWRPKPILTPFDIALNQLKTLDDKNLLSQQKIKEYYTELTDIVRNYIEQDLKISAMEVTSDELVALLKKTNKYKKLGISREQINHLQLFLQNADLVKFAKAKPETDKIQGDRNFAEVVLKEIKTVVSKPQLDENGNPIVTLQKEEIIQKTTRKRRLMGVGIGVAIVLLVAGGITWHYGIRYVKDTILGHPTKELLEGKWYRNSYGYPGVNIETPVVLKAMETPLPPEVTQILTASSSFVYGSYLSGFTVVIMTNEYREGIQFKPEDAEAGAMQNLKTQKGLKDLKYQSDEITIDGITGKKIYGTFKAVNTHMTFVDIMIPDGQTLRQIIIAKAQNDPYAEQIEKRMLKSIRLEKVSE